MSKDPPPLPPHHTAPHCALQCTAHHATLCYGTRPHYFVPGVVWLVSARNAGAAIGLETGIGRPREVAVRGVVRCWWHRMGWYEAVQLEAPPRASCRTGHTVPTFRGAVHHAWAFIGAQRCLINEFWHTIAHFLVLFGGPLRALCFRGLFTVQSATPRGHVLYTRARAPLTCTHRTAAVPQP